VKDTRWFEEHRHEKGLELRQPLGSHRQHTQRLQEGEEQQQKHGKEEHRQEKVCQ
jgi:hypothetical protein